jgi:ABC-type sugar transport system ATPase subunit
VLFTEHSMDVVFAYADRMIVLARGKLIAEGNAETIRNDPRVQEVYFGTGKTFQPHAALRPSRRPAVVKDGLAMSSEPMLKVSGLNAFYGRAHILFDVGLEVGRGEVVALMGRNGAGKSTTMKAVMGMLPRARAKSISAVHDIAIAAAVSDLAHGHGLRAGRPPRVRRPHRDGEPRHRPPTAARRRAAAGRRRSCSVCSPISVKCPIVRAAR